MSPEFQSFLTLYAAFLCLFSAIAFAFYAGRLSYKEAMDAKRHRARMVRRLGALHRSVR
jgi:hypothetical protein